MLSILKARGSRHGARGSKSIPYPFPAVQSSTVIKIIREDEKSEGHSI